MPPSSLPSSLFHLLSIPPSLSPSIPAPYTTPTTHIPPSNAPQGASHSLDSEQDMKVMRESISEILTAFRGDYDLTSPGSG